ncbi:hypothetical protein SLA2020_513370 [Shorea laevis]
MGSWRRSTVGPLHSSSFEQVESAGVLQRTSAGIWETPDCRELSFSVQLLLLVIILSKERHLAPNRKSVSTGPPPLLHPVSGAKLSFSNLGPVKKQNLPSFSSCRFPPHPDIRGTSSVACIREAERNYHLRAFRELNQRHGTTSALHLTWVCGPTRPRQKPRFPQGRSPQRGHNHSHGSRPINHSMLTRKIGSFTDMVPESEETQVGKRSVNGRGGDFAGPSRRELFPPGGGKTNIQNPKR